MVGVGVTVAVGVNGMHIEPAQDALETTLHPPQVRLTGAEQKSAH